MARIGDGGDLLKCSFCGKSQKQVKKLIAGPGRLHLRRVHRPLQRDHRGRALRGRRARPRGAAEAAGDLRVPQRVRHRPGRWRRSRWRSPSTTTTSASRPGPGAASRPTKDDTVELAKSNILMIGPDRLRQDLPGPDAGPDAQRAVRHRGRDRADRGRVRRRGRREHPAQADPGGRLRRQEGRDGHHLHRRDRQGRPQVREPVDHPRRLRRGRAAGAAEDPRGHDRVGAAAGRAQAPAPGVHPDRHDEHPVHRRRRLLRARAHHRAAGRQEVAGLHRRAGHQDRERHRRAVRRRAARGPAEVRADPGVRRPAPGRRDRRQAAPRPT